MKIEICCPNCDKGYLVDQDAAGHEFVCPGCTRPVPFRIPPGGLAAAGDGGPPAGARDLPPGTASTPASSRQRAPATVDPRVADEAEIVCPRCSLHFRPRQQHVARQPRHRPAILLVVDPGYFRGVAVDSLSDRFDVTVADNAGDASTLLATGRFELLVLDPGVSGGTVLLRPGATKRCPTLLYTAEESDQAGDRWAELRQLGADDIVVMGMHVAESLQRKVAELLGLPTEEDVPS